MLTFKNCLAIDGTCLFQASGELACEELSPEIGERREPAMKCDLSISL